MVVPGQLNVNLFVSFVHFIGNFQTNCTHLYGWASLLFDSLRSSCSLAVICRFPFDCNELELHRYALVLPIMLTSVINYEIQFNTNRIELRAELNFC